MKLSLIVLTAGKQEGKKLEIKALPFLIGRDAVCHLRPVSPLISKQHCAFIEKDGKVVLQDFGSTNGTVVNGEPVQGEIELKSKDRVKVGPIEFEVVIELPVAETKVPETRAPEKKPAEKKPAGASVNKAASAVKKPVPVAASKTDDETVGEEVGNTHDGGGDDSEDIAAMLLSQGDDGGSTTSTVTAEAIPDGSTVLDMPVPPELQQPGGENKDQHQKAKESQQNTSQAARDILAKYMRRPR